MTVQKWTGRESRALREAMRLTVRDFASRLGVSHRAISKWEAGGADYEPRPDSQAILDTFLSKAPDDARIRFEMSIGSPGAAPLKNNAPDIQATGQSGIIESAETTTEGYPRSITHPIDGKPMVLVEADPFPPGPNNQMVALPSFYIDVYPTTNKDYEKFIVATGRKHPAHWTGGKYPLELAAHPVVNVTYRDAEAYAMWARKELPSALEWEKSARGPDGTIYPWGNQETPAKCNVRQTGVRATTPVDRYHSGASHYGVYDLAGNVWEWCRTETDPGRFVLKGSAFTSPLAMASAAAMNDASETMLDDDTGFRCVSHLETIRALLDLPQKSLNFLSRDRPVE